MTSYAKGYRTGWISYLAEYRTTENSLRILEIQADMVAERASHGLLPKEDYWLGYHHGRIAAQACVDLYLHVDHTPRSNVAASLAQA